MKIIDRYGNIYTGAKVETDEPQTPTSTPTIISNPTLPIYNTPDGIRIELEKRSKISIYNINGQIIYKKITNSTININNLPKGIYIIQINNQTQKIII